MKALPDTHKVIHFGTVIKKMYPYLRPYQWRFLAGFALILVSTGVDIVNPLIVGRTVDTAISPDKDVALLTHYCFLFLGIILTDFVVNSVQGHVIQSTGHRVTHELRGALFQRMLHFPVSYFDQNPVGRPLTRVINDIKSLGELFTASISALILDVLIIVGTVIAMFWVHWKLAAAVLVTFPVVLLAIHFFGQRVAVAYRRARRNLSDLNAFLGENVGAVATIQRLGAQESRLKRFHAINESHFDAQMKSLRTFAKVSPIANTLNGASMATLLLVGGYWVADGSITVGLIVIFLGYIRNLFVPVRDLVEKYNTFLSAKVSAERVVDLLDAPMEVEPAKSPQLSGKLDPPEVVFEDVSFTYPTRRERALENVSFRLPARQSLAVVGATGSGKSTLIRLLLRFYDLQQGTIQFAGQPLEDWDKFQLRKYIGVVHQEIYLFQGTVRDNLTLNSKFSDNYLRERCEAVQLWPYLEHRGGLDAPIQEGGSNLSIGERQLLAFARVLIFNCPLLVLDEATASVDRILERKLMDGIDALLDNRTSIVIAHRLSTIRRCDQVLVIDKGQVAEQGPYDQLLAQQGLFHRFHSIHANA